MRELFQSRRRNSSSIPLGQQQTTNSNNRSSHNNNINNPGGRLLVHPQHHPAPPRPRPAQHQAPPLRGAQTQPSSSQRIPQRQRTGRRSNTGAIGNHHPNNNHNNQTRSINHTTSSSPTNRSQPSTATMTVTAGSSVTTTTAAVPTFVHGGGGGGGGGAASYVSRSSFDDETSWMSGVESHRSSIHSDNNSHTPSSSPAAAGHHHHNPYLRDGKATKRIIDDLSRSEDPESTLTALSIVCVEFDHNDVIRHNAELYYGAIEVLAQKLSMTDHQTDHDAIRMICAAMEMVFRGGSKYVKEAFRISSPVMVPPLLRLVDKCEQSKVKYADEVILNITKTFHYVSRIPELRVSLARQQGLLDWLQRVATAPLDVPSRNVRVRLMANLANCHDNKVFLYTHKGFLTSLLKIAQYDLVDATREYATVAIMDLASAPANQIPLAKNGHVLRVLTAMVGSEKVVTIRENVTATLQNLAFPKGNRKRLVEFYNGVVMESLLSVLLQDPNEKARRRAAGALTNLAFDETAERMAGHPGLLRTLANVSIRDGNHEVQSRACLALTKIASSIGRRSSQYGELLTCLVIASKTTAVAETNISAVFRLRAREAECRESMARHEGVLETLADMCIQPQSSLKDRDNATRALMHLANETVNRTIMCNEKVLEALVRGASCSSITTTTNSNNNNDVVGFTNDRSNHIEDQQHLLAEIQDSAIRAIARLATELSNRPKMAKHKGLLTSIAKATERESKLEARGAAATGAAATGADKTNADQQQTFLGKPLLLSLLMAM